MLSGDDKPMMSWIEKLKAVIPRGYLRMFLITSITLLILSIFSLLAAPPESDIHVIVYIDIALTASLSAAITYILLHND